MTPPTSASQGYLASSAAAAAVGACALFASTAAASVWFQRAENHRRRRRGSKSRASKRLPGRREKPSSSENAGRQRARGAADSSSRRKATAAAAATRQEEEKIFVSVASYRDADTPNTMREIFARANHPRRVFVGVIYQVVPGEDDEFLTLPEGYDGQIRKIVVPAAESKGACWARHQIQAKLYRGEDYYLMIDSHSRFNDGWDDRFIDMLKSCPSDKPALSTYPVAFTPPRNLGQDCLPALKADKFNDEGVLLMHSKSTGQPDTAAPPRPNPFMGANCFFSRGEVVSEVPYDPYLYFHGEEITYAARLWTYGYDLFTPNDVLMYHDYYTAHHGTRTKHWDDDKDWPKLNQLSFQRIRYLLAGDRPDDEKALEEIDIYGLGDARTIEEYECFADVSFTSRFIGPRASDVRFPMHYPSDDISAEVTGMFSRIYFDNLWKDVESRSGSGATKSATRRLCEELRRLFFDLNVRTLADAGCGDLNWITDVTDALDLYAGYDVVPDIVNSARSMLHGRPDHLFAVADVSRDALPRMDAILCRNCLNHLPLDLVQSAIGKFKSSGSRYLLATSEEGADNDETKIGHYRKIDLLGHPFNLPKPIQTLQGDSLGVWDLHEL